MIDLAIEVAAKAHEGQLRKATDIPYITHPFSVGMMLARVGCSEEVIAAGILHDTLEDTRITLGYLQETFGEKVASMVEGASEPNRSLSWESRKKHTIDSLKTASLEIRLVVCADKLHNIRTIAADYEKVGEEVWKRFKRGRADQEWYFRELVESLSGRSHDPAYGLLLGLLRNEVERLFGLNAPA